MRLPRLALRAAAALAIGLGASVVSSCSESPVDPTSKAPPRARFHADAQQLRAALDVQVRYTPQMMRIPGVVGTAVGLLPNGQPAVRLFLASADVGGLPSTLDGIPVSAVVTGMFMARSNPTARVRPAPLGFSVGHFAITAGSIGARVVDGTGNVFVLSNNHVLANSNDASLGDAIYQPGPFDGGSSADQIATLFAFKPIDFSGGANTFDAALGLTTAANTDNASPTDDGYGQPNTHIYGDANSDGVFDDVNALLGLPVQKFGRTTKLTKGQITGINGTVTVCYEVISIFCVKAATFTNQFIIDAAGFSGGGDSGSLIVSDDGTASPVALLFAGSSTQTIANRIDFVLNFFGVTIDGGNTPPPAPVTDVAITSVSAPASVAQGNSANVVVTIRNAGNQNIAGSFDVTLQDATDGVAIGTQSVATLAAGASTTRSFTWNPTTSTTLGAHTLTAAHSLVDDDPSNDSRSATSTVTAPGTATGMHVGDLDGSAMPGNGNSWSATVEVTIHDANHNPINGATVKGIWNISGLNSNTCTTGDLGGNGSCIVLFPGVRRSNTFVTYHVLNVIKAGQTFNSANNHDVDGSSNGTIIRVNRP
jgi:CARDB protein